MRKMQIVSDFIAKEKKNFDALDIQPSNQERP